MADNNIVIKITSEANLGDAQKQMQALIDESNRLEKEMNDLKRQEKEDAESIKALGLEREKEKKRLRESANYYKEERDAIKKDIAERKKSIKELENQIKSYKTLQGQTGKAVQQLRAMREELMRMEDAGEYGTQAFIDLSVKAAELEDKMGDLQQRIRILASDTKEMDAVMGLGDGIAGTFYIATSAAEVFGEDMEGLQKAFYKVQAAMSIVSGAQQVYNALQKDSAARVVFLNAVEKVRQKTMTRGAALQRLSNIETAAGVGADGAKTASTGLLTKAQIKLNTAIAANPLAWLIGLIVAAVAALAGLGVAVYKLVGAFSAAEKAQRSYEKHLKTLQKLELDAQIKSSAVAQRIVLDTENKEKAYQKEMNAAKKRSASDTELLEIEKKHADERAKIYQEKLPQSIAEYKKVVLEAQAAYKEALNVVNNTSSESKRKKALEQLKEAEEHLIDVQTTYLSLTRELNDANQAAFEAELALAKKREELNRQIDESEIRLMREGAAKEIAQIKLDYRERLKEISGNSAEEMALRASLLAEQEQEIAKVRKKYALQAKQTALQEQKNLLTAMSQSQGTEADYAKEIKLTKKVAEQEANARIAALDKEVLGEKEYEAQVEAIRLDLAAQLAQIDEQEVKRQEENAKRRTSTLIKEAENAANALRGDEPVEQQLETWDAYYQARQKQIKDNAQFEIDEAKRAAKRGEITAEQLADREKEIEANKQADLTALAKDGAQKRVDVQSQALIDLEIAVAQAEDKVSKAQTGGQKIDALKEQFNAQKALYAKQKEQLDAQYAASLISYQDYKQQEWEITKATTDAEVEYQQNAIQAVSDSFQTALDYIQQISDMAFEALGQNVQAELDALEEGYTTDWKEAQKSANKKYITEKEYEKKKAALEEKQAKYAKAQAIINAGINTALAIVTTLAQLGATPWGIAAAAIAGVMGAAQIGVIASKPLAQYAKGRKGGEGEYALVGEKGAEIMYVPSGASIIPHDKIASQEEWGRYGVPRLEIPELPHVSADATRFVTTTTDGRLPIDYYDKFGEAVARNIPRQQAVTVNVDRSGVHVSDGSNVHTYLNAKYNGVWD